MGVKGKLKLLAFLSIIAIFSLTAINIYKEYLYTSKIEQITQSVSYSRTLSKLLEALQKERAINAIYLQSQGEMLASEMDTQRIETDKRVETFRNYVGETIATISDTKLRTKIEEISKSLEQLKAIRRQIDKLRLSGEEMFGYYNSIDDAILSVLRFNAMKSPEGKIARELQTYYFLLSAKEIASRQQARFAEALISETLDDETLKKVVSMTAKEVTYLDVFQNLASSTLLEMFESPSFQKVFKDTQEMTRHALKTMKSGRFDVDLQRWFGMITKKNEEYRHLEAKALETIEKEISRKPTLALYSAILGLFFLIVILLILRSLNREISRRIHSFDWIIEKP
ncbi:MAG: hypothetical protein B6D59_06710 [Campylobacteraceae bacterium 4484_4]|nr:MAG: hypothetical protein B6D59_06710 [Campylobacteraceae bacterium 4484_4]